VRNFSRRLGECRANIDSPSEELNPPSENLKERQINRNLDTPRSENNFQIETRQSRHKIGLERLSQESGTSQPLNCLYQKGRKLTKG
jgi:hypothetical protein